MGPWTTLLVTYLLGGVTFIPLVVLAVLVHAHYTFPYRHDLDNDDVIQPGDDTSALEAEQAEKAEKKKSPSEEAKARATRDLDVAAGYFAVCREYTPMGLNAKPIERSTPVGPTTVASPSPSVYQTMYRSIFDRKPVAGPLDNNNINNSMSQRPKRAGNVFYVVLRHGHLMLFDDEEQLEVRHVISLAHYDISIYSGGGVTPEGELFIKRNALCLSRRQVASDRQDADGHISKPFYLFSENCSAKEDFYFALLRNQEQTFGFDSNPPIPKGFEVKNIISLVQRLHSSEDHVHSRWFNAMLGRIFLAVYRTRDLENFIREKITKKISRVKRPSFLANITIQKIDTGEAAPYFTNLKLKDLTVEGECLVEADVRYTGNFRIEVGATVKIDLGTRFKAREVTLLLAVVLKRIEGHILFKVKAPPSNRLWMSFQTMPKMEMVIEPIVSSRQITYTLILRQIENRIKEVFAETLVQPFWDDVPFFKTEHKTWRGGIFQNDDAVESSEVPDDPQTVPDVEPPLERLDENQDVPILARPTDKSSTVPVVEPQPTSMGFFGRRLGKSANGSATSVLTTSIDSKTPASGNSTPRSLNIVKTSTEPVVGTENAHADLFKPSSSPPDHATNLMASLASRSQEASPLPTPFGSPAKGSTIAKPSSHSSISLKESEDKENADETDATPGQTGRRNTTSSAESIPHSEDSSLASQAPSRSGSFKNQTGSLGRNFFARRDTVSTIGSTESSTGSELKRNTLAAVTNAAEQARQWGLNAIRRQKDHRQTGEKSQVDLSQPMGRGQPLPPVGTPLPGPTNGVSRLASVSAPKRKPLPASSSISEQALPESDDHDVESRSQQPPALPQRRRRGASQQQEDEMEQNMLVVAAPDDSQPGTPAVEEKANYDEAWAAAVATGELAAWPAPKMESKTGDSPPTVPEIASGSTGSSASSVQETLPAFTMEDAPVPKESPLVALPAAALGIDDDDDLSGWLEDDTLEGEQDVEPLPVATTRETN